jgi:transcriptional regulator with XRE-family HTH domain
METEPAIAAAMKLPYGWMRAEPGAQLRALRVALHMSQRHLAESAGLSHSVVSELENGKSDARLATWRRLFEAMGYWAVLAPVAFAEESED